jgi:hypothetical protein
MSAEIDFKALWSREESDVPALKEIYVKAGQLNAKTRNRIRRQYTILSLTVIFLIFMWWYYQPKMLTTKIGLTSIIVAIIAYLAVAGQLLPLLFKVDLETDSRQYLNQLINIRHKQEFLNKTMLNGYFILLSVGIFLYMIEYVNHGSVVFQLTAYGITFLWIAFNWFYIRPKTINKQQKAINDVIGKLESLNGQLVGEE